MTMPMLSRKAFATNLLKQTFVWDVWFHSQIVFSKTHSTPNDSNSSILRCIFLFPNFSDNYFLLLHKKTYPYIFRPKATKNFAKLHHLKSKHLFETASHKGPFLSAICLHALLRIEILVLPSALRQNLDKNPNLLK